MYPFRYFFMFLTCSLLCYNIIIYLVFSYLLYFVSLIATIQLIWFYALSCRTPMKIRHFCSSRTIPVISNLISMLLFPLVVASTTFFFKLRTNFKMFNFCFADHLIIFSETLFIYLVWWWNKTYVITYLVFFCNSFFYHQ